MEDAGHAEPAVAQSKLHLRDHPPPQSLQGVALFRRELSWRAIDDTERAEVVTIRGGERRTGVEAYVWRTRDQRIVPEALVQQRVGTSRTSC